VVRRFRSSSERRHAQRIGLDGQQHATRKGDARYSGRNR
jgi:hypothetical protein